MDSVKNKMEALIKEKLDAIELAKELEATTQVMETRCEEYTRTIQKNERDINKDEGLLDDTITATQEALEKLDVQDKLTTDAEQNLAGLVRKIQLLEEESARVNERLRDVLTRLEQVEVEYEDNERARKILDSKCLDGEEQLEIQAAQLEEATILAEDADRKFEEMSRKLRMVENDNERVNDRANEAEEKIQELEDNIQTNNGKLKELEVTTTKNSAAEDVYEQEISKLRNSLGSIEDGADFSERTVEKLEKSVDQLDDQLYQEKFLFQKLSQKIDDMLTGMNDITSLNNIAKKGDGKEGEGGEDE